MTAHLNLFTPVPLAPADPILGLTDAFNADLRPTKVNLGVGAYQNEQGKLPLLDCVRVAEQRLDVESKPRPYLPINGLASYDTLTQQLVFGANSEPVSSHRVVTVQALGGTGALKLGADFAQNQKLGSVVYVSVPSWANHQQLFARAGFEVRTYRYYDAAAKGVDCEGMLADLAGAPAGAIVILHACCHNPTGYDLTPEQWTRVLEVISDAHLVPFLDMAYQGFSQGLDADASVVRQFAASELEFFCATSFSKSFSLYGERVGALHVICSDHEQATRVASQLQVTVRTNYSNPPTHGAAIVAFVLGDPELRASWEHELSGMRERIKAMRQSLVNGLVAAGVSRDMSFITDQIGMFSYSGLTKQQMVALREQFGVYGTDSGRICIAALNPTNVAYVSQAIAAVL